MELVALVILMGVFFAGGAWLMEVPARLITVLAVIAIGLLIAYHYSI